MKVKRVEHASFCRGPQRHPRRQIGSPRRDRGSTTSVVEVEDVEGALAELRAKGVGLLDEQPRVGHGNTRIAFLDPESTANVLIESVEVPHAASHTAPARPDRTADAERS